MIQSCLRTSRRTIIPITRAFTNTSLRVRFPISQQFSTYTSKMANLPKDSSIPGEQFEPRQTHPTEDYTPDPSKSLKLSPARQALVDDILDLYSCKPTVEKVKRYTPDCVYDDQFVYANDRYKMAGQWFALPKLFKDSKNEGYQIVVDEPGLIQFRNEQVCYPTDFLAFPSPPSPIYSCFSHPLLLKPQSLTYITVVDLQNHPQNRHHQRPRLPLP